VRPSERIAEIEAEERRENWALTPVEISVRAMKRYLDEQHDAREAKRQQQTGSKKQQARA